MKKHTRAMFLPLAVIALLLSGLAAKADPVTYADSVTFDALNPDQSTVAGGTVEFDATITNTNTDPAITIYLNSGQQTSLDATLSLDDSAGFWLVFPASLNPGQPVTGELFTVTVAPGTPNGSYQGEYLVQGGADGNTYDTLGVEDFTVTVNSPVPEPPSMALMLIGMLGLVGIQLGRRFGFSSLLQKSGPYVS